MNRTIVVLYKGFLVYYFVTKESNGHFSAHLTKFCGRFDEQPPHDIILQKIGRHWAGDEMNQDLLDDIGDAIEFCP